MISDMPVTENYSLIIQPPVSTAMQFFIIKEPGKVINVEKAPSMLHLVPRIGSGKTPKMITIPFDGLVEAVQRVLSSVEVEDAVDLVQ